MENTCEYIEYAVVHSQQGMVLRLKGYAQG
jgi:hypothetical protein